MDENRVVPLRQPDEIDDPLTEILRCGAKRLVQRAVEAEFAAFMARHADLELPEGHQRVVRHGHDPVRPIKTGIDWADRGVEAEGARSRSDDGGRAHPLFVSEGRGGRRASTFFCRLFICAASRPATFRTC